MNSSQPGLAGGRVPRHVALGLGPAAMLGPAVRSVLTPPQSPAAAGTLSRLAAARRSADGVSGTGCKG